MGDFRTDCYLSIKKRVFALHPEAHFEVITRTAGHVLSPSRELLNKTKEIEKAIKQRGGTNWAWHVLPHHKEYNDEPPWHNAKVGTSWDYYVFHFIEEMRDNFPAVHAELDRLRAIVETKDVYLICYESNANVGENHHCHRFIVRDILERKIIL